MAKQKTVTVNGKEFKLQSVSPSWYFELSDECGLGTGNRDSKRYVDTLLRNCVIAPAEVKAEGIGFFDKDDDFKTCNLLVKEIDNFLKG